jgi:hypothetical protein
MKADPKKDGWTGWPNPRFPFKKEERMRRRRNFMAAGLGLFFMIAAVAHPSGLSFRFFGGAGFLPTSGDFKELFDSTSQRWKDVGIGGTFDLDYAPWAYEGGLQAVFQLAPSFGLRLGVGYFSKVWNQSPHLTYNGGGPATLDIQNTYDLKSIPLTLDAVVTIPLGIVRFNIFGGGGYYLTLNTPNLPGQASPIGSGNSARISRRPGKATWDSSSAPDSTLPFRTG